MCLATLPGLLLLGGCSGINTTHSVSPASFFLPGLMKADPPPAPSPDAVTPVVGLDNQLAQAG
jgi:hypothetical protein